MRDDLAPALAVVALVPAVFSTTLPPIAVVREREDTRDIPAALGQAVCMSGVIVGIAVLASGGSPMVGLLGGAVTLGLGALYLRACQVTPYAAAA